MTIDFTFVSHLATFILAINAFSSSSQCSLSLSILAIILAFVSLLPFICASALLAEDSLVYGGSGLDGALASIPLNDGDSRAFMSCASDKRCPGHLDEIQDHEIPIEGSQADGLNGLLQESAAPSQTRAKISKGGYTHHEYASLRPHSPVLALAGCSQVGHTPPSNESSVKPPAPKNVLTPLRDPLPGPNQPVDLDLSVVGRYLARYYGVFAWRIYPLIRIHNAFADLDASFRRLDMFMYSVRAGMLYHELIVFVDHTTNALVFSDAGRPRAMWQMYAARTRACDVLDLSHTSFRPVDGDQRDGAEVWQNCLQWDAPIARVLNTAYMRRTKEAYVQRWDADAREYWQRGEGLSNAKVDRVAKAILAYGVEFPMEEFPIGLALEGVISSSPKAHRGIQNRPGATHESEAEDDFLDESGCAVGLSSYDPDCDCRQDPDACTQGVEVGGTLCKFDFAMELGRVNQNVEHGFKYEGGVVPQFDFGSLDSILSDATPPPASVTPSSSDFSSSDVDLECILYPRLVRSSTPISRCRDSRFLGLGSSSCTHPHPVTIEESPSFATSSDSEQILANFSAAPLAFSTKTNIGMNIRESGSSSPSSSSSPRAAPGFTSQHLEAHPCDPSLLDLALALGTRDSEKRSRKRELTNSSSYPSPPPSPSPQCLEDKCPQAPDVIVANSTVPIAEDRPETRGTCSSQSEYKYFPPPLPSPLSIPTVCDANGVLANATRVPRIDSAPAPECGSSADFVSEIARESSCTRRDSAYASSPGATHSLASSRKLRVTLNVSFKNPHSCDPSAGSVPVGPSPRNVRTAFSLWEAIMRPQTSAPAQSSGAPSLVSADIPGSDPNSNSFMSVDCGCETGCGQTPCSDGSLGVCSPEAGMCEHPPDTSDGEWEIVRLGKKTRRGGEKARRQRERRRARIEAAEAWNAERSSLAGTICMN